MASEIRDERYPIGKFTPQEAYSPEELSDLIDQIANLPTILAKAIEKLSSDQFDTPYREGGWTVRQVVHHLADSHMNAFIRIKWTLTEETPVIKAYDEKAWATTPETKLDPMISWSFLSTLHVKWVALMQHLSANDLKREFIHPATNRSQSIERMLALYAWHGVHHVAHINALRKSKGWI